ncbi:serine hydrolase domain-containing protein [Anaeromyxobacter sp. Red801]|uniref:serine hydrolase domain-containing protein n=1 Tax=Anaeromyxobacter sp. Red801 TaxID=3411632 RepID=UPI003BA0139E
MSAALPPVTAVLEAGARERVAPALSAAVLRDGRLVHASWHGELSGPAPRALRRDDLFDVASLTKVMATTTLAAQLVEEGALDLDAPVADRLPGFEAGGKAGVTARHLLAHSSGLPRWRPYFERAAADPEAGAAFLPPGRRPPPAALAGAFARGRARVREAVLAEPLEAAPGARAVYCDPGFIALGLLVEALGGAPLAVLAERRVFRPLGLGATFFLDGLDPAAAAARAAGRAFVPTGACPRRGEAALQGEVNDDNAWAMGGAAGHAGVFSTAPEVAALGQAWLEALEGRPSVVPARAAAAFAERDPTPGSERALGWDTPSRGASSLGGRLGRGPRGALGHLGFTGTSLWIDRDARLVCALLTNHVHPAGESDRPRIRAFRQRFHDAVAEALGIG